MPAALIACPDGEAFEAIRASLGTDWRIERASDRLSAEAFAQRTHFDFIFIDLDYLETGPEAAGGGGAAVGALKRQYPTVEIVVLARPERVGDAVTAVREGASHYVLHPVHPDELHYVRESLEASRRVRMELEYLRDRFWKSDSTDVVQTRSAAMRTVLEKVRAVAPTKTAVLLTGETGTGKGVVARLIHRHSSRSDGQFISIHCGAVPETLLESELFGHEKGAFTGAVKRRLGKFELAKGGTLFLDEIGTVSQAMQIKLLQVLQDKAFQRVGGEETIESDVRIIAASNEDLEKRCLEGTFRTDLYYRLNVFPIEVPPLRHRKEDIPLLLDIFLKRLSNLHGKSILGADAAVSEAFNRYAWPGNIREMENLVERACILEGSGRLTPSSLPAELFAPEYSGAAAEGDLERPLAEFRRLAIARLERTYLEQILRSNRGHIARAAAAAGIGVRQLHKLMKRHGLEKEAFKRGSGSEM